MKFLNMALVVFTLTASSFANAGLITTDIWHFTGDEYSGFKQSTIDPDIYYALTTTDIFSSTDTYEALVGFHWASRDEYLSYDNTQTGSNSGGLNNFYMLNGGTGGYPTTNPNNTLTQHRFMFSDSATVGGYLHASNYEGYVRTNIFPNGATGMLGLVMIRSPDADGDGFTSDVDCNDSIYEIFPGAIEVINGLDNDCNGLIDDVYLQPVDNGQTNGQNYTVPEPSSIAIFGLGLIALASRRFKKQS